jgi:hypothetical protein
MRRIRFFVWVLAGLLVGIMLVAGCGKKGDPIPPQVKVPAAIADLSAASSTAGIILRWSLPVSVEGIGSFRILRSDSDAAQACPGCPQDHRTLVQLAVADGRIEREEGGKGIRYIDTAVKAGRFYSYRVVSCNPRGYCGEASNTVQMTY